MMMMMMPTRLRCIMYTRTSALGFVLLLLFGSASFIAALLQHDRINRHQHSLFTSRKTSFFYSPRTLSVSLSSHSSLESILENYGYGQRICRISKRELPVLAEIHANGTSVLGYIQSFQAPTNQEQEPKCLVRLLSGPTNQIIVDFGQITTIWKEEKGDEPFDVQWSEVLSDAKRFETLADNVLDRIYRSRVGRARTNALNKKEISNIVNVLVEPNKIEKADSVLRKVIKAGTGFSRLVDSRIVGESLFRDKKKLPPKTYQRALATHLLSNDANLGGRYKRWPTVLLSIESDASGSIESIAFVNGGWLVVDQSVRYGTEARKFVERMQDEEESPLQTLADERILRRLECLAMGEIFSSQNVETKLELDVREVLTALNLPSTPDGGKQALLEIGHWTGKEDLSRIQPWAEDIIRAAYWYANMDESRHIEPGRTDLRHLPCICIDEKSTAFRDDAIGLRPRSSTGRKVVPEASKWEVLVHITDVSDIYILGVEQSKSHNPLSILLEAAQSRGTSRYDLPLGPLHLMPPVALRALSLSDQKDSHRCVTVWAYIDERNGKILDAGLEQTLISKPIQLTYESASSIMSEELLDDRSSSLEKKARAVLLVLERNLSIWKATYTLGNEYMRRREARLDAKSQFSRDATDPSGEEPIVSHAFQRTPSHILVDMSLDLYSYITYTLMRREKAPVPMTPGADISRGGRIATGPLRRYIDGQSQRQALAVLCGFGRRMSAQECREAGKLANQSRNTISNVRAFRR